MFDSLRRAVAKLIWSEPPEEPWSLPSGQRSIMPQDDNDYRNEDDEFPDEGGVKPLIKRSSHWATVRKAHLIIEPICQVCGSKENLQVHHMKPVHKHPELELVDSNLITLCQPGHGGCHLLFGHSKLWRSWNQDVHADAAHWRDKIKNRPE